MDSSQKHVLLAGGTGLVGTRLTQLMIESGYHIHILSRKAHQSSDAKISYHQWDLAKNYIDPKSLEVDAIVNLAGAGIADKRWTPARKKEIIESRTMSTALIHKGISEHQHKPTHYIGSSAIGIYGSSPQIMLTEDQESTEDDFMVDVCRQWEEAHHQVASDIKDVSILRIGIVLSTKGGALKEILKPLEMGRIGAYFGDGQMIYSWIHIDDLCQMIIDLIDNKLEADTYNAVAPNPTSNKTLVETIETASKKKALTVPAPSFVMKLVFGEMSKTILNSTSVSSSKIENAGFGFQFPELHEALAHLLSKRI